ncbi:MAG: hypothetical protein IPO12_14715 [Flavobacteriales bacterium]|nr:hypothetical protein [Flavobacteriales bacterium]
MRGWTSMMTMAMVAHSMAQVLSVPTVPEDTPQPVWDAAFIQRNGVTAIIGTPSVKRDGQPIREQRERTLYKFDDLGRQVYANTSFGRPGTGTDTASTVSTYDADGCVKESLRNDLAGHYLTERTYDYLCRVTSETYVRVENLGPDRYQFLAGQRTVISQERHVYRTESDTAWIRTTLNDRGLPYREQRHAYDRWGYLRSIEDRYLVSGRRSRVTFRYNEKGRLAERIVQADLLDPRTVKELYHYDVAGNLTASDLYHGDKAVRRDEYLYEENTMFLKARLSQDLESNMIRIMRYHTERR